MLDVLTILEYARKGALADYEKSMYDAPSAQRQRDSGVD